ncbi:MAG TPA: hypothetical protein DCE41_25580 [Cytophagales bacterium]|nr:hypothetical protein [Cytophagales bacterium]HAA19911.1 hypothetical protein [Cytophagales bacterium]HAP62662.1 hypothetical protein [Cytophagales bacterium]
MLAQTEIHTRCIDDRHFQYRVYYPTNRIEISDILKVCQQDGAPIFPVSSGNNWGYGAATAPDVGTSRIMNLSQMPGVIDFDPEHGLLTFGPGLTQQGLYEYLTEHNYPYMTPTNGAGPHGNILGNLLERGFGLTPIHDHAEALLSLKAVLPDGSYYQSSLGAAGFEKLDRRYKWGVGAHLDTLFTQSNFGVVYEATIRLAKTPDHLEVFSVGIPQYRLGACLEVIREYYTTYSGMVSGVNFMNARRMLAMRTNYRATEDRLLTDAEVKEKAQEYNLDDWTIMGSIYAPKPVAKAIRKDLRRKLRAVGTRPKFIDSGRLKTLNRWKSLAQRMLPIDVGMLNESFAILQGKPSNIGQNLCYTLRNLKPEERHHHPLRDNTGLLWFAPLIPFEPKALLHYIHTVEEECTRTGIEPLITLTTLSGSVVSSTVPILYRKDEGAEAVEVANRTYTKLLHACAKQGVFPYRLPVTHQEEFTKRLKGTPLAQVIKQALDPQQILAPGRYLPIEKEQATHSSKDQLRVVL